MGNELNDAYRGTTTISIRNGLLVESVSGVGSRYTDLATGARRAVVQVTTPDGATTFGLEDPECFENRYL